VPFTSKESYHGTFNAIGYRSHDYFRGSVGPCGQPPVGEQVKQNPANLDTTSESSKSISTSLSNLDYGIESLCKLKAIFYKLKGNARQQEGKVNITVKELSEWIQAIQSAESEFEQFLNLLEANDDSDS